MELTLYSFEELTTTLLYQILAHRLEVFTLGQRAIYRDCDGKDFSALHLVGRENGGIVAYLRILPPHVSFDTPTFGRVSVCEGRRGSGYGKMLVKAALGHMEKQYDSPTVRIAAQADVEGFYKRLGFITCSELYEEQGVPHLEMVYHFPD